ncbi:galactose-6-phosphate isomerase subunit LacA [Spiroplasma chinense]|uniref:Galactose-6-phosphate isomerase subunit LacA n=1 Tax=Spiroplasma chinense TaxID=216932 RepID=A0A5B9Y335_9MOLU|nr:RpiB/LacA/LacB family sugar-phosphate isomerase [Spiroplasma chinense]QEH61470.1 galactose-6-phosphate isomerase subunit LacA [Spiroplasma chinense]
MEKIVISYANKIEKAYIEHIKNNVKNKNFELIYEENSGSVEEYLELVKKIQNKEIGRVISIEEFGTLPFMVMAKNKGIVVAQISDHHSSRMTIQHNNSNVLSLGYKIMAKENMVDIIETYLGAHFEAGRHMVRINMLENILEGE